MSERSEEEKEIIKKIIDDQLEEIMSQSEDETSNQALDNLAGMVAKFFSSLEGKGLDREVSLVLAQTYLETIVHGMMHQNKG